MIRALLVALASVVLVAGSTERTSDAGGVARVSHGDPISDLWYVATTGNDTTGNGSIATPWRTISKAITAADDWDVIYARGGTYDETISTADDPINGGTTFDSSLRIEEYPGETAILAPSSGDRVLHLADSDAAYVWVRGFELDASGVTSDAVKITWTGTETNSAHHVRLQDLEIHSSPAQGVLVSGANANDNELIDVESHSNGDNVPVDEHGFYLSSSRTLCLRCVAHDNASNGVMAYNAANAGADGNRIVDALAYDNADTGIMIASGVANIVDGGESYQNDYGLRVFDFSIGGQVLDVCVHDNVTDDLFIHAGASGTIETGTITDPTCVPP